MSTSISTAILTVDYAEVAITQNINKLNRDVLLYGITKGGLLSRIADNQVSIAPFTALFQCDYGTSPVHKILIKVYNPSAVSVNVTDSQPYVVMNLTWLQEEDNYPLADIKSEAELASLDSSYIIVGKVPFTAGIIDNPATFDYTRVTRSFLYNSNPDSRHKLISRAGIEPGISITEDDDVINLKYLNENTDIGLKPNTQIPFGDGTNVFSYSSDFVWNDITKILDLNGNINLNDPTSDDEVGDRGYMDTRYFNGTAQTTMGVTDRIPLYDGNYKYTTIGTIHNKRNTYSGTGLTIADTDNYDKYISAHTASTGLQQFNLPTLADNLGKRYTFQNQGLGLTYINSEEGANILFKEYTLDKLLMVKNGNKAILLATATGWLVEDYCMSIESGFYNRSDFTSVNIGFANFDYDTKSGGTGDMTGEKYTLASGVTGLILEDDTPAGAAGTVTVCFVTGTGLALNNEVGTCGSGQTFAVDEGTGDNKNQDWDITHNMGINQNDIEIRLYLNLTTGSFTNSYLQFPTYSNVVEFGFSYYQTDANNVNITLLAGGLYKLALINHSTQDIDTDDIYVNTVIKITM